MTEIALHKICRNTLHIVFLKHLLIQGIDKAKEKRLCGHGKVQEAKDLLLVVYFLRVKLVDHIYPRTRKKHKKRKQGSKCNFN
jgi:hypothetical protein